MEILRILEREYPRWSPREATVKLMKQAHGNEPFKALITTILSSQTKDSITSKVARKLFSVADTPEKLANMDIREIEEIIKPVGFYKRKALYIKQTARIILEKYGGKVPETFEELVKLPGVGRKVANVFLANVHGKDVIGVDVHVHRIANRLKLVRTRTPKETEEALYRITPKPYRRKLNLYFVAFGQAICSAKPKCSRCPIVHLCPFEEKNL